VCFDEKVIGPFFSEEPTINGDAFMVMRRILPCVMSFWEQFSSYTVNHLTSAVFFFVDREFLDRWIGRGSPHSPDFTPLDFSF
jgi:hypothetical protein